jgi:hypothetical protein
MYKIKQYSYEQAKKLNVSIKPSTKKDKKIDVFKNGHLIASVGKIGYFDFPTYIKEKGLKIATEKRKLYKLRHNKDRNKINSNGFYADKILW